MPVNAELPLADTLVVAPVQDDAPRRRPSALARLARNIATTATVLLAVLVVWEGAVRLFQIPDFILPPPSQVLVETVGLGWGLFGHLRATLTTILGGYGLAILISLPLSIAISSSRRLSGIIYPLLVIKQSIPVVALAPILIVMVGAGEAARMIITLLIALFPLVVSTSTGLSSPPAELIELSRSLHGTWHRQLIDIRLPSAVPHIFSALKVSMTLSVVGAVVAEFVAAERGLGFLIYTSTAYFHLATAFGAMVLLSLMGLVLFQTIVVVQRRCFPWSLGDAAGHDP